MGEPERCGRREIVRRALLVLHLNRFLCVVRDEDMDVIRSFPPECVPIADGKILQSMDQFVVQTVA